jgi:hypothetical protein
MEENIPNDLKIYILAITFLGCKMAVKYANVYHSKPSKIFPNWDFGLHRVPSGVP